MFTIRMLLAAVCRLGCLTLLLASPPAWAGPKLPDTPAGRIATAFFEAFNSADDEKMRAFESQYRAESALKERPIDDRIVVVRKLRADLGDLVVDGVFESSDLTLSLGAVAKANDEFLRLQFELEPAPPNRLLTIRIERGGPRPIIAGDTPKALDAELRADTVQRLAKILKAYYVFPEVGITMAELLRKNQADGVYDSIIDARALADRLTSDLRAVCNDKHLRVRADEGPKVHGNGHDHDDAAWRLSARDNYGFERVERLPGNIGYIKLNQFSPSEEAQKPAAAAMNFVSHCDGLIFDLRENGGGSPSMIVFLSNYLFEEATHLNSFYNRHEDETTETRTSDQPPPGGRFGARKPVYVLTSSYTFSGAEEFAYNLKNLKRASIVGQTTGGGAHPVDGRRINDAFMVMVPFARAINPITKTNWEGVGVKPDIEAPADQALSVAHQAAIETLLAGTEDAATKRDLERALRLLKAGSGTDAAPTIIRKID